MKDGYAPAYLSLLSDPSLSDAAKVLFLRFNVLARGRGGAVALPGSQPLHEALAVVVGDTATRWKKALEELCAGKKPKLVEEERDGERHLVVRTWDRHALGQSRPEVDADSKRRRAADAERQRRSRDRRRDNQPVTPRDSTGVTPRDHDVTAGVTSGVTAGVTVPPLSHSPLRSEKRRGEETRDAGAREAAPAALEAVLEKVLRSTTYVVELGLDPVALSQTIAYAGDARRGEHVLAATRRALEEAASARLDERRTVRLLRTYAERASERDLPPPPEAPRQPVHLPSAPLPTPAELAEQAAAFAPGVAAITATLGRGPVAGALARRPGGPQEASGGG